MSEVANAAVGERSETWRHTATVRRFFLTLFVVGQTVVASYFLLWILPYHGGTWVELGLLALFILLYMWIAVGFWTAVFGFVLRLVGGDRHSLLKRHPESELENTALAKTAIIMPIYHEPVQWTLSGLKAVYQDIERTGQLDHFEFHIISDSRDPNVWLQEQAEWHRLCEELGAEGRLFYRRRRVNLNFKSGNVADFLRRWGRRYRYMVVLDADSLLSAKTIVKMVQLMEREPRVGILQTAPTIINGESLFARVQQFANRLYSSLFATGLAAIQMGDAAFWGHNAILRIEPFMAHCGLRKLRGFGLFRGPIMSHDFVEAAYMGRAGYEVWLEPELGNSFEESPPTISDELSRDNRWSRGNLQHLWILLFGRKLRLAHRMALLNGIMAYLASPLWLAFLILTTVEAVQMTVVSINYFPDGHQGLFPLWPEWRPEWAIGLALSTLSLLFLPKFLAILDAVIHGLVRGFGGVGRLFTSVLLEIVVSVLLAPVRMMAHSRYVLGALLNVSLSWAGQNRTEETTWRDAFLTQFPGMLVGAGWSTFAWSLDPMFFLWSLPVAVPLVLAAPTSVVLSRVGLGRAFRRKGLLMIPEELTPVSVLHDARSARAVSNEVPVINAVEAAVIRPRLNRLHSALARAHRQPRRAELLAPLVLRLADKGPDSLSRNEISQVFRDRTALAELHQLAWRSSPDSFWGRRISSLGKTKLDD
jgi:membrane glycosyltransferase